MLNINRMNELVGAEATAKEIIDWAYNNRIWLSDLPDLEEFEKMEFSVLNFLGKEEEIRDEKEIWSDFLSSEFKENEEE